MSGQMCWLAGFSTDGEKVLHLRLGAHQPWKSYRSFSQYAALDHDIPGGSQGMATFQKLLKAGWTVIPSDQAQKTALNFSVAQNQS